MTWRLAPAHTLALAAILALLLVAAIYVVATQQPWLGIEFKPNADNTGLEVVSVHPNSPNRGVLSPGDVVVGLGSADHQQLFEPGLLPKGEFALKTFAILNRYVAQHEGVWRILTSGDFVFILADEQHVAGRVVVGQPGTELSFAFWSLAASAVFTFLIGIGVWTYRPNLPVSPIVAVGGISSLLLLLLEGLQVSRELALSPFWMRASMEELNFTSEIAQYSYTALLWYYPTPRSRFPFAGLCVAIVLFFWINETLQLIEFPGHTYVWQYLISGILVIGLGVLQWRESQERADARAALQWYLLSVLLSSALMLAIMFVPTAYLGRGYVEKYVTFYWPALIYLGLALGIARYRLFDLERWWLEVWLWLGGGLLVIGIDVVLITFFHLADLLALGFALILAGWVYLPLRQWLFRRVLRPSRTRLDDHFPLLIETLFSNSAGRSFGERWRELVQRVFQPLTLATQSSPAPQTVLTESGLALQIPSFDGNETYELRYREQGRRLYTPRDVTLADSLLALTRRAAELWQQREEGAKAERGRIMRDLHDDVAGRLLTLMHRSTDVAQYQQAHEALSALRETIYALDDAQPVRLGDFLNEVEAQGRDRLRDSGAVLEWREPDSVPDITLTPRERINLTRTVQEAVSNALRHARPARVQIHPRLNGNELSLHIENDGALLRMEEWKPGKGVHNIRTRMAEIGGTVHWAVTPDKLESSAQCRLSLTLPLARSRPE